MSDTLPPHGLPCHASLSFTIAQNLLKLMSIEPSSHLILNHPLLCLASIFPNIRVFSIESALHIRRPEYWNFSISPSSEYSGLISNRMDWFDLLAVKGTLESLLQHQFQSISSSELSLLYGPTLTSVHVLLEKPQLWLDGPLSAK